MSSYADINIVSFNVGALSNANRPLFKVPTGFGGVTVKEAHINAAGTSSSALYLVAMGTAGTAITGTIATLGTVTLAANVPQAFTMGTLPYVGEGVWLALKEGNAGALNAVAICSVAHLTGK